MSGQGRIVLCGATGHTGRLTAAALVAQGVRPLLGGRNPELLRQLGSELGGCDTAIIDLTDPGSIRDLLSPGDVVLSTVGPFARAGAAPVQAAIDGSAWYVDSTGEPPFIRTVFELYGPHATVAGLIPAFGYDFVPGNLAAALALAEAGETAVRVDVGYYLTGALRAAAGPAARASLARAMTEPMHAWRSGIREEPGARRMRSFTVDGRDRQAISIGATEHFALPRLHPQLTEVKVYLGWIGQATPALHRLARVAPLTARLPFGKQATERLARVAIEAVKPTPDSMTRTRSWFAAAAYDAAGVQLAEVSLDGPHHLALTVDLLAWASTRAVRGQAQGTGALGPAQAFGLDALQAGCEQAELSRVAAT